MGVLMMWSFVRRPSDTELCSVVGPYSRRPLHGASRDGDGSKPHIQNSALENLPIEN